MILSRDATEKTRPTDPETSLLEEDGEALPLREKGPTGGHNPL